MIILPTEYQYNLGIKFYAISQEHAERIALKYPDDKVISYAELNEISNKIARLLLWSGIRKGSVIAIFNEKSHYAFAFMLGCLKIGAIYTNVDITSPWLRLKKIIDTCEPAMIVFDALNVQLINECETSFPNVERINLYEQEFEETLSGLSGKNLDETYQVHGGDPAYIMFTSGSTGFPKGAVMSHNNVLHFIQWGKLTFDIKAEDIFTNVNPAYFDNSVFDFYSSIYNGATLVPLSHELVKDARQLVQTINSSGCTIWFSVPSLLVYLLTTKAVKKEDFSTITRISFGGEGFPKNKLKKLFEMFGDRAILYNVYGPTECTCICSSYIVNEKDFENMYKLAPLGLIAPNFDYEILPVDGSNMNLGELALVGPCVGLGYYNDPQRTSQAFIQNPNSRFCQLMYKTGDLVEKADNGYLYFKGRSDNQVKHMGYRIELEEVEAAFNTLDYINEAGVIYEKVNEELGQIKAFVSVSENEKDMKNILDDIKKILPPYMVPRKIIVLNALPKNSNGKIDRKQLAQL